MRCVRRRLNKDWADAVKYEQMYLEFVKESSLEAKELMETESSNYLGGISLHTLCSSK